MSLLSSKTRTPLRLRSKIGSVMVAGGMTAAFVAADGAAMMSSASAAPNLAGLRACESGGNYSTNTGNGYYGAYQFSAPTWRSLGLSGLPHQASAAQQDAAVLQLAARSGWNQWPVCSRKAGSSGTTASTETRASRSTTRAPIAKAAAPRAAAPKAAVKAAPKVTAKVAAAAPKATVKLAPKATVKAAPKATSKVLKPAASATGRVAFPAGEVVSLEHGRYRAEVRAWQARMAQRGWTISVDGYFGPQSSAIASAFAAEKGISATAGTLNASVYNGAWSLKIS